jgi:Uma2 family endonuclease
MSAPTVRSEPSTKPRVLEGVVLTGRERVPMALNGEVRIPGWVVDLASFRRWACSDAFPERGRFSYLGGELWVDLSMEEVLFHNQVKGEFAVVLGALVKAGQLGRYYHDRVLLSNADADLSTEPDGMFVSYESLRSGRLRGVEGAEQGYREMQGSPDMVLEVVSWSSVQKDTVRLRNLYWRAGVTEYWLVDAREDDPRFDILRRGRKGFVVTRRQGSWLPSSVFGASFQLTRGTDPVGDPLFTLAIQPR